MNLTVVLHRPRDVVNIAVVVRAMRNFGVHDLRLVAPVEFDPWRIEGIAHNSGAVVDRAQVFEDLDTALAEFSHVVGTSARGRTVKRNTQRPVEMAGELSSFGDGERIALLFGPEDRGLTNTDLDRCHRVVTIPTTAEHPSLNLAQAATVLLYELFTRRDDAVPFKRPRRAAPPVTREALERLFADAEQALTAIEFFKARTRTSLMRTLREVAHRARLDARETALLRAMCLEVVHYLDRREATGA